MLACLTGSSPASRKGSCEVAGGGSNTSPQRLASSHQVASPRQRPMRRMARSTAGLPTRQASAADLMDWTSSPGTSDGSLGQLHQVGRRVARSSSAGPCLDRRLHPCRNRGRPHRRPTPSLRPSSKDRWGAASRPACPGYSESHCIAPAFSLASGRRPRIGLRLLSKELGWLRGAHRHDHLGGAALDRFFSQRHISCLPDLSRGSSAQLASDTSVLNLPTKGEMLTRPILAHCT